MTCNGQCPVYVSLLCFCTKTIVVSCSCPSDLIVSNWDVRCSCSHGQLTMWSDWFVDWSYPTRSYACKRCKIFKIAVSSTNQACLVCFFESFFKLLHRGNMALFKKANRKRQTHIIHDVEHIDWQWKAIQCCVYMDSDWMGKKKSNWHHLLWSGRNFGWIRPI